MPKKEICQVYGIRNTRVAIAALAQVATQTRTKLPRPRSNIGCESVQQTFIHSPGNSSGTWPKFCCHSKDPHQEYITAVEVACQSLKPTEAEEIRADIARVLKQARPSKPNISKEGWRAIKELRTDKDHLILTVGQVGGSSSKGQEGLHPEDETTTR